SALATRQTVFDFPPSTPSSSSLAITSGLQPQVDGPFDHRWLIWPLDAPALPGGLVSGIDDLQHFEAVLARLDRFLEALHPVHEVLHLLGKAVVPLFLEASERPAGRGIGLLDSVAVADLAMSEQGVAVDQVGARLALRAIDLGLVINAARLGPAILRHAERPILKFDDAQAVILTLRLVAVHEGAHLRGDALHLRPVEDPASELDGVAAHVEQDATARQADVPEPRRVRPVVLLALLDEEHIAERPLVDEPLGAHILRREAQHL